MAEPYIGQIIMFGGNFAPRDWAFCDGSLLPINQFDALFALIGTTYGGNGQSTFGLPDLRGRVPVHYGQGPGLPPYRQGEQAGVEAVTLLTSQIPVHGHGTRASADLSMSTTPTGNVLGAKPRLGATIFAPAANLVSLASGTGGNTGGSQPHTNIQPSLGVNFVISLFGIFPSRN